MKNIEIIGGGTVYHVRNHLALTAPAYGKTARYIHDLCLTHDTWYGKGRYNINLHLTKMAGGSHLETNEDVSKLLDSLLSNPDTKIIFFNPALVDYKGTVTEYQYTGDHWDNLPTSSGKYAERLKTSEGEKHLLLTPEI